MRTEKTFTQTDSEGKFLRECIEWLQPLGFTFGYLAHCNDEQYKYSFLPIKVTECDPVIHCWIESGHKKCEITNDILKVSVIVTTGRIPFRHPSIAKHYETVRNCSKLIMENYDYSHYRAQAEQVVE